MPSVPPRRCTGCKALITGTCRTCEARRQQHVDRHRGSAHARGYDSRWQKARATFLARNPLCVDCAAEGLIVAAAVVDHVIPHKGNQTLFWDESNWAPRCKPHHDRKTATEDGGFGRVRDTQVTSDLRRRTAGAGKKTGIQNDEGPVFG